MSDWASDRDPAERADVHAVEEAIRDSAVPRRERIATAVLGAIWARPAISGDSVVPIAVQAVRMADALIAELDKEPE